MMWKSMAFELGPLVETHCSLVVIYQVASLQHYHPRPAPGPQGVT